jgi:hypothetical protein
MKWKKILKAPVPLDTAKNRDTKIQQNIVNYEKQTIEPALTKLINEQGVGESKEFTINFTIGPQDTSGYVNRNEYNSAANANMSKGSAYYYIGTNSLKALGGNTEYIMKTLRGIYKNAGYRDIYMTKNPNNQDYYLILTMD